MDWGDWCRGMKGESPKAIYFFVEKKHVNTKPQIKNALILLALGDQSNCSLLDGPRLSPAVQAAVVEWSGGCEDWMSRRFQVLQAERNGTEAA